MRRNFVPGGWIDRRSRTRLFLGRYGVNEKGNFAVTNIVCNKTYICNFTGSRPAGAPAFRTGP